MTDDVTELGRRADANLAGSWTSLGAASGAAIATADQATFVATGIPVAFFNGVFVSGPVTDPDRVVADAVAFMAEQDVPWLMWVRDGVNDGLLDAGRRAGLTDAGGPPGMALATIPTTPPTPDALRITTITERADLEIFRDLTARGFELPTEIVDVIVSDPLVDDPSVAIVIGWVDDTPVSCAMVSVTGTTAGVYNVATPAEHRRCGYGAALTWAAIEQGARRGCDHSILQASEMGAPVYRAMGFVDISQYVQLEGPPSAT